MGDATTLTSTLEDYLEAISQIESKKGAAHVKDIAEAVSVHMSTVTTALRNLAEKGLVNYSPYKAATLTKTGQKAADRILRRHRTISKFLSEILLIEGNAAEENACRMEHVLDEKVMEHLTLFAQFVKECPRAGEDWLNRFRYYLEHDGSTPGDEEKMEEWLQEFHEKVQRKKEEEMTTTLDNLKAGEESKIKKVGGGGAIRRRMVDMGAVKGTPVRVIKVAPLGDPIEVKIKGYNLTLRKEEAAKIEVEKA